jgi:hypothetical protein
MASPSMTYNSLGNIASAVNLAAAGTSSGYTITGSSKFSTYLSPVCAFGTVAATSGVKTNIYDIIDSGGDNATVPTFTGFIVSAASTTVKNPQIKLETGNSYVTLVNTDATNAVTYTLTTNTVDSVS